jgi:V/A-type H+-transporting ATPase subunit E
MAIDDILGRIEEESRAAAAEIIEEARRRAAEIRAGNEAKAEELGRELLLRAEKRAGEEERRLVVSEGLELRKSLLAKKREILDALYRRARERIEEIPEAEYRELVKALILKRAISGREEIVVSAKHRKLFGGEFIGELNEAYPGTGGFALAGETGDFEWGVVLREGRRVVDLTLDVLFERLSERMEPAVAAVLFPADGR